MQAVNQAICDLDAVTLRRLIRNQEISIPELLESCIARIEAINPYVNAVVSTCFEQARKEAREAQSKVMNGQALPPLHGLPVLIKDLSDTAGVRTTYGSLCFKDNTPESDSAVVSLLKKAGAIVIGKTNTPEFGAGANTTNKLFGATCNPFNSLLTSGGSSGGSAVALACGMAPLATGSDLGGSLRIPASFCSIVGVRPSPGQVPSHSHACGFSPLWTDGPMARTVADADLMLDSMSQYLAIDPLSHPGISDIRRPVGHSADLSALRVGFTADLGFAPIDSDIKATFEAGRDQLTPHFGESIELPIDLSDATDVFRVLRIESIFAAHGKLAEHQADLLSDNVMSNIRDAEHLTLKDTARANARHTEMFREFQTLFEQLDVIICPATAVSPFPVQDNFPSSINGQPLDGYQAWYAITWALSLMGCPIATVPCGTDHAGMPFGIQVIGGRYQDKFVMNVAKAVEQVLNDSGTGRILPDLESLS